MAEAEIGIIGGTGLYKMPGLSRVKEVQVTTPFGKPSHAYILGLLEGRRVAFLARHGRGHRWMPSELNFRANIYGLKKLGVERIISVSAVGSLREDLHPLDMLLPSQFFDRTQARPSTFFGGGIVAHVGFSEPVCPTVVDALAKGCSEARIVHHVGGTYVCIEGPAFSTVAESNAYRAWGMDVVGMTNLQEAKLAREAEICYATLAMVTDYDCWHPQHDSVTVEQIISVLVKNAENAAKVVKAAVAAMPKAPACKCGSALAHAILTERDKIPAATKEKLKLILGKYLR